MAIMYMYIHINIDKHKTTEHTENSFGMIFLHNEYFFAISVAEH